uniref:Uncharacterized protein n=1 Tax=Stylonychia lemnae TaxID=5949 RepID=A0A3Q8BXA1_STYLE|nr:hypothetical protein [Stylonychia lemnae]
MRFILNLHFLWLNVSYASYRKTSWRFCCSFFLSIIFLISIHINIVYGTNYKFVSSYTSMNNSFSPQQNLIKFKNHFKNLNFYSMPTSILFIVRKRLNIVFMLLFFIFFLFFSIY